MAWRFDQAPNVAAITTVGVLEKDLPILVVQHFEDDDSWAFLCGTTDDAGDGRIIAMKTALELDSSLETIADLPPGWTAHRASVDGDWHRESYRGDN